MFNIGPTIPQERLESIPIQPETTRIEPTPHLGESYFNKLLESKTIGGPDRDRTDDLFHAMEARSQLRHRPTPRSTASILADESPFVKPQAAFRFESGTIQLEMVSKSCRVSEHSAAGGAVP